MNNNSNIDMDTDIPSHAVSIVEDNMEDFPVLKAFQQYIDAEQNKARKRMISLCIFFGCLMTVVIVIFLILLNGISMRNQALNDRMIDYVMKERDRQAAVVVQQPSVTDHSAVFLTAKIEEMQKKLAEAQEKANAIENARKEEASKAATEAAVRAAKEKARLQEEIEVARLKALLAAEREKAAAEREKKRQEEIEAYRRKHYPELYEQPKAEAKAQPLPPAVKPTASTSDEEAKVDREIDTLLKDLDDKEAITYFDAEDTPPPKTAPESPSKKSSEKEPVKESTSKSLSVEVKGKTTQWLIPNN